MEKRVLLAIVLSMLVLLMWSTLVPKQHPIENKEVTAKMLANPPALKETPSLFNAQAQQTPLFDYFSPGLKIIFIEPQAAVKEVAFPAYKDNKIILKNGFTLAAPGLSFEKEMSANHTLIFNHRDAEKKITKKFIFSNSRYDLWLELNVQSTSNAPIKINLPLVLGSLDFSSANNQANFQDVYIASRDKNQHLNGRKNVSFNEVKFVSLRNKYFCAILEPEAGKFSAFIHKINNHAEVGISAAEHLLLPGEQLMQKFHIYLGPQQLEIIKRINPSWSGVIYFGTFDFISQMLLLLLEFLYKLVHSWGWAIVILSLLVYLILYPLTLKQMRSMKEMQLLQPKIEELRKIYKDNPQRLNKEVLGLYRLHKVNPLGGCLPLLLQMPIFFALYQALMRSVALKGSSFLWIKDLSEPDRLFLLPVSLPILGNEVNILPILMTIGMFIQQKITMAKTASGTSMEQQKLMLFIFPLMFGLIFYRMPSGLVLYWFINSTLMLLYQLRINRAK